MHEYVQRGGMGWGPAIQKGMTSHWTVSWPFATIRVTQESIRLTARMWRIVEDEFEFDKNELRGIQEKRGFPGRVIEFRHEKNGYPPKIQFYSFRARDLVRELHRLGYVVQES